MHSLNSLLPTKSPAPHADHESFASKSSEKSSEPFAALMSRALSQPRRERADDCATAKKPQLQPRPDHAAKAEAQRGKQPGADAGASSETAKPAQAAVTADAQTGDASAKTETSDANSDSKSNAENKKEQQQDKQVDSMNVIALAMAVAPEPETISPAGNSARSGNTQTVMIVAAANSETSDALPTVTDAKAETADQSGAVSKEVAKLGAKAGDGKKVTSADDHPAKKAGSKEGLVPVDKLLAKAQIAEQIAVNTAKSLTPKPHAAPPPPDGISTAEQTATMKNADTAEKISGQTGQNLPDGAAVAADERKVLQTRPVVPVAKAVEAVTETSTAAPERAAAASEPSLMISPSSQYDLRLRALDRAHDIVALHAMRMKDSHSDSLHVVIKPGAGLQLSLHLKQSGDAIEAQAVLNRGDFQQLNQHWSELQQRLEERGIKLAALTGNEQAAASGSGGFQQSQNRSADREPLASGAFAEFALAGAINQKSAQPAPGKSASHRGWESWA